MADRAALVAQAKRKFLVEQAKAKFIKDNGGNIPVGAPTNISNEQRAKNAEAPFKILEGVDPLDIGLRPLDYAGGLIRTGLATVGGLMKGDAQSVVSDEDAKQALQGKAPLTDEYLERMGVPQGPSIDLNPFMEGESTLRGIGGFAGDVATGSFKNILGTGKAVKSTLSKTAGRFGKPTAEEVERAAQALGVKPTKGMMTDDYVTRNLEDSLSQSPTIAGGVVRSERTPILNAADDATREALEGASPDSALQAGRNMKAAAQKHFEDKLTPLEKSYDEIGTHTKNIDVNEKGLGRIANNIRKIEGAEFQGSDVEKITSQFAGWLQSAKSVDAIKRLRTKALEIARDPTASAGEKRAAAEIAKKLFQAQNNTITRQAVKLAKEAPVDRTAKGKFLNKAQKKMADVEAEAEGLDIGRKLVGDIKQTNKSYRGLMEEAREFGKGSGLTKAKSARGAIDDIAEANPQEMASALFDSGNLEYTYHIQKTMPKIFEMAKGQRLAEIASKVQGDPKKLASLMQKMSPEEKVLLFGNETSKRLDNVSTLLRALPNKVGASDTPRGQEFRDLGWITGVGANLRDVGRYGLLKSRGLVSPNVSAYGERVIKQTPRQGLINSNRKKNDKRN